MNVPEFTLAALKSEDARITEEQNGIYSVQAKDYEERICFEPHPDDPRPLVLYTPLTPPFQRLVKRTVASGVHSIADGDLNPRGEAERLAAEWVARAGAKGRRTTATAVTPAFNGTALLRVRATVAHDSYEQLVGCACDGDDHHRTTPGDGGLRPIERILRDPGVVGLDLAKLGEAGERDDAIAEFRRFYEERREEEIRAAGGDARKRQKLQDDFTPQLDMVLVGLEGKVRRDVTVRVRYGYEGGGDYESELTVRPATGEIITQPDTEMCAISGHYAPKDCLAECAMSGARALKHLLVKSDFSDRFVQPEFIERCELSGRRALPDELEESTITGRRVATALLKQSAVSGARAEPEHFDACAFSKSEVLKRELGVSEISGKPYRLDQAATSAVSGKTGHAQEFTQCFETRQTIARTEGEACAVSGRVVRPGVLQTCAATGKRVLPSLLATCQATRARVLKARLVTSSISNALVLREKALRSIAGTFCLPTEAETCLWSGRRAHPDDVRHCALTGLAIHSDYTTPSAPPRLRPLVEMLDGIRHNADQDDMWDKIAQRLTRALKGGDCRIEAAILSPSKHRLATCAESKTMLGLRVHQIGAVYDLNDDAIVGRLAQGKRNGSGWVAR